MTKPTSLNLAQLVAIFARTGSMAFGGGAATLAMLHDEFCVRRTVVSDEEFQVLFGLSRLLPGMNLLSLTVLLGYRTAGLAGSLLSLVGLTVPSFTIIVLACASFRGSQSNPFVAGAIRGLAVGAAALLATTGWRLGWATLVRLGRRSQCLWLLLMAAGAVLALSNVVRPAWVVLGGAVLGIVLTRWVGDSA
jgi:chromate transporter